MNKMGIGLLSGLAVGAAIGLMTAPKPGVETRAMLKERAQDMRAKAGETVSRLRMRGERAMENMSAMENE
jgi:gas vesicle protein